MEKRSNLALNKRGRKKNMPAPDALCRYQKLKKTASSVQWTQNSSQNTFHPFHRTSLVPVREDYSWIVIKLLPSARARSVVGQQPSQPGDQSSCTPKRQRQCRESPTRKNKWQTRHSWRTEERERVEKGRERETNKTKGSNWAICKTWNETKKNQNRR